MLVAVVAFLLGGSPSADLRITVWPQGLSHAARVWTLRCSPDRGTLPARTAACRRLSGSPDDPFAPTPPRTPCTQIYGGPQVARVVGSFRGRHVQTAFTRRDGCAIARWNRVSFLFPVRL